MGIQPSPQGRKGAWTPSHVLALSIITLVVLAILLLLYGNIGGIFKTGGDKEACSQSIRLNAGMKLKTVTGTDLSKYIVDQYGNSVDLQCSTEYLKVRTDKPEKMKETIAKSMMDCWQMYGAGELEVFETRDNTYCAVCSRLEFEKETQLPQFTRYLMDHQAPQKDVTYMQYFKAAGKRCEAETISDEEMAALVEESGISDLDFIDTGSPLAVIFYMTKEAYPGGLVRTGKLEAMGIGIFTGMVVGLALCLVPVVGCFVGVSYVGVMVALAATATVTGVPMALGAGIGYAIGSSCTSSYDAYVMLWNYSDLRSLGCTYLESEAAPLEVRYV